ncbi:MAG: hypothetical protein Q8P24_14960 [Desulfobacterales bacterium]|nr:hypothetical protein [Desulfobacterales bacterium]
MFSKDWDLDQYNRRAAQVIQKLQTEGLVKYLFPSEARVALPSSSNIETADHVLVVCSGYPEHAGIWSYTLLEKSIKEPAWFEKTSMEPYFRDLADSPIALVVLNPHAEELKLLPDESLDIYLSQLRQLYEHLFFSRKKQVKLALLGFSIGAEVILRFLKTYPHYAPYTKALIFVDPVPPRVGRKQMPPELSELVDHARFYGLGDPQGKPGQLADFTSKLLGITPEIFPCEYHGEMPNLIWPRLRTQLPALFT